MKTILLICNRLNMDRPLRRSLTHLVKSCRIEIVPDGHRAYAKLKDHAFNLIIIDFEIAGIDSLELVESIEYIDPGVPVILMLKDKHKAMWGPARTLNADPILRPFKPFTFLRLVDNLLHQHLERYREMSETLQSTLKALKAQPGVSCVFLAEGNGQVLLSNGQTDSKLLLELSNLAVTESASHKPSKTHYAANSPLVAQKPLEKDHALYIAPVIDNLRLAMIISESGRRISSNVIWQQVNKTVINIRELLYTNAFLEDSVTTDEIFTSSQTNTVIPLKLETKPKAVVEPETAEQDEVAVNWQILTNNADTLTRLQNILSA